MNTHKVIYSAANVQQAYMLRNSLDEQGISAYVTNDVLHPGGGMLPFGLPTAPQVVVREEDAIEARRLALEFDELVRAHEPPDDTNPWQFKLSSLFYLTVCTAIYFAIAKATDWFPTEVRNAIRYMTFLSLAAITWYLVFRRKRIEQAAEDDD